MLLLGEPVEALYNLGDDWPRQSRCLRLNSESFLYKRRGLVVFRGRDYVFDAVGDLALSLLPEEVPLNERSLRNSELLHPHESQVVVDGGELTILLESGSGLLRGERQISNGLGGEGRILEEEAPHIVSMEAIDFLFLLCLE